MTSGEPLLAARGVARRFGSRVAVRPLDLDVPAGTVLALVGANGAGKSTLLALLAGALPPSEGRVDRAAGVRVGWAPQRPAHYGRLSARENLELFARLEGEPNAEDAATRAAALFGIGGDGDASALLSSGTRQRLNLALAMLGDPTAVLLDEPTASLDPASRERLWGVVRARKADGAAIVFATQHVEELREADVVAHLEDGALAFVGDAHGFESREPALR